MRTKKPISTISYCSEAFLIYKLESLRKTHDISFWAFIHHEAEDDEKKAHKHLLIFPNKLIDTMVLQEYLTEIDYNFPDKPFKCIDFKSSKAKDGYPDDWILYSMHHDGYLASKNESREYAYIDSDFVVSDIDTFEDMLHHALKGSEWAHKNQLLMQLKDRTVNPSDLIENGSLPLNMACQVNAYNYMRTHYGKLDRGVHDGHE